VSFPKKGYLLKKGEEEKATSKKPEGLETSKNEEERMRGG